MTLKSQRFPLEFLKNIFSDRLINQEEVLFRTLRTFFWRNYLLFLSNVRYWWQVIIREQKFPFKIWWGREQWENTVHSVYFYRKDYLKIFVIHDLVTTHLQFWDAALSIVWLFIYIGLRLNIFALMSLWFGLYLEVWHLTIVCVWFSCNRVKD